MWHSALRAVHSLPGIAEAISFPSRGCQALQPNDGLTLRSGQEGDADYRRDSLERDERRLAELGRRTLEVFVVAHVFCDKLEIAYREAEALKRQVGTRGCWLLCLWWWWWSWRWRWRWWYSGRRLVTEGEGGDMGVGIGLQALGRRTGQADT